MISKKPYLPPIIRSATCNIELGYTASCYNTQHEAEMTFQLWDDDNYSSPLESYSNFGSSIFN